VGREEEMGREDEWVGREEEKKSGWEEKKRWEEWVGREEEMGRVGGKRRRDGKRLKRWEEKKRIIVCVCVLYPPVLLLLTHTLSLCLSPSLLCHTLFVIQALIMAPQSTPYDSGCFLFDIFFPNDYPKVRHSYGNDERYEE
jgi:hypothetical protein